MSGYAELRGRRMLVVMTSRGTLLRPNIKDADVSVADDLIEALTYTMPAPRPRIVPVKVASST